MVNDFKFVSALCAALKSIIDNLASKPIWIIESEFLMFVVVFNLARQVSSFI